MPVVKRDYTYKEKNFLVTIIIPATSKEDADDSLRELVRCPDNWVWESSEKH